MLLLFFLFTFSLTSFLWILPKYCFPKVCLLFCFYSYSTTAFLNFRTIGVLGWIILSVALSVHGNMFSSICGPLLLFATIYSNHFHTPTLRLRQANNVLGSEPLLYKLWPFLFSCSSNNYLYTRFVFLFLPFPLS